MGFRFRKRIRIFPGLWFNLSKSGVSTSIGGKGLTINLKDGKARSTICAQGTGISYRTSYEQDKGPGALAWIVTLLLAVLLVGYLLVH